MSGFVELIGEHNAELSEDGLQRIEFINLFIDILCFRVSGNQMYVHLIGAIGVVEHSF